MQRYAAIATALLMLSACTSSEQSPAPSPTEAAAAAAVPVSRESAPKEAVASAEAPMRPEAAAVTSIGAHPIVELYTSKGAIAIELDAEKAPVTTKNFLEYVRSGFYDGTVFHRVIPGFMIQGGGMTPDMNEKSTRGPIVNEGQNGLKNVRGSIAMARTSDVNSATAQFFINVNDNGVLDYPSNGGYAVFGKVIAGMDVADAIVAVPRGSRGMHDDVPNEPIIIQKAQVKE